MNNNKTRILLVDDDEEDFVIAREIIKDIQGFKTEVVWEDSYKGALDKMVGQDFDVFLVDFHLGSLSGIDLMQEAIVHGCDRPFIILTGQGEKNTDLRAIQSGASDYLQKSLLNSYVLEKSILYAIERNKVKKELVHSQKTYKFLFEELRTKNQIIESILNSLPIIISRLDLNGDIIDIFGSGLKMIDANPQSLMGLPIHTLFVEPEVSIEEIVQKGFISIEQKSNNHADNGDVFQSFYFFNTDSSDILLFSLDVSDSKKTKEAYQQVNIENRKLNKINELLDNIIFMTAHDLRSPISNLKMINHLIHESDDMNEKMELLEKVTESTNRMENVINGLVEIIEIQKEGIESPQVISFHKIFEHVYAEYKDKLQAIHASVHTDFSQVPEIKYMEAFLISIFSNLVGNAIKYRSEHNLDISISTKKVPGFIVLTIADNGIGIDLKKYHKTIFKPFSRVKGSDKEGKGIGLHLVKTIVEKNGGRIEVESEPGKGTRFTLFLSEY